MYRKAVSFPAILIMMIIGTSFGIISIGHILSNTPLKFFTYVNYATDYKDFFTASNRIITGKSPYDSSTSRYVTTPVPAIANIAFVPLGFGNAVVLLYLLIPLSLALGYQLITSMFGFAETDKNLILTTGFFALLFGYPFYFLLQRENIDGWVFLFLCLGLYWLPKPNKELVSGLFFSLAIAFKIYPILIIIPILLNKRWRVLFWTGLWSLLWGGTILFWLSDFRAVLALRSTFFTFESNGSLVATVGLISLFLRSLGISFSGLWSIFPSLTISLLLYGLLLSIVIMVDYKLSKVNKSGISMYVLYLPFMVAIPKLVYHYSLVICLILIPTLCHLWETSENRLQRIIILCISIGIGMTQWQANATYLLTDDILSYVIPGLGLLIIMTSIAALKINNLFQFAAHQASIRQNLPLAN